MISSDSVMDSASALDAATLAEVLAEIAEATAETLDLQDVFERVATAVRRIVPVDRMGVVRIVDGESVVLHAISVLDGPLPPGASGKCACSPIEHYQPTPLASWSPRARPRVGPMPRVDDAVVELDPAFPFDRRAIERGVRSVLWEPFRTVETVGGVWLSAFRPRAFTDEHQRILRPIAALLGAAVEHWRIWDAERRRRERLDGVEALHSTLAESLELREVFERLSTGMQPILPHDLVVLTELDMRAGTIRVTSSAGPCDVEVPTHPMAVDADEIVPRRDFELVPDILASSGPVSEGKRFILGTGLRSWLRVPLWLAGEWKGCLSFMHREPSRYDMQDVEVARRLADRIGLSLSIRRMTEEARIAAEAQARAERLEATVETLASELEGRGGARVVGVSSTWKDVLAHVARVAPSETTVLITGESGTGKEIVARLLRQGSPRASRPLVAVNCAALPEHLLESEIFGHERGAFTGAVARKIGRLEQASGGTLFLDEIAELSPVLQAKFLRVLQEREYQRIGGTQVLKADVRVVAATNRDLAAEIARGRFREDLYYRLNVFEIHIAPLRERPDDILPLAQTFLDELSGSMGRSATGISREAREWLLTYAWPGNVRELRNAIERAILLCDGALITRQHLPVASGAEAGNGRAAGSAAQPFRVGNLEQVERGFIERALEEARGNKAAAARKLGLSRSQLYTRLARHGLDERRARMPRETS
jgi:transcriptional regulator with GAF, ATPase, and Fis domain